MSARLTEDILRHVRSLPPLPIAVQRLLSVTSDPKADVRALTRIIEKDQVLTARILRVANSSFYGLSRRVETISKAVVILGFQAVRNIALRVAMLGFQRGIDSELRPHLEAFWKHAIAVASAAELLATALRLPEPEVAFVAGLLHDLGKMVLMEVLGERYARLFERAEASTAPLHVREQAAFGITHTEAGQALCMHWKIPSLLTRVVATHHTPTDSNEAASSEDLLVHTVRVANELAKLARIGSSGNPYVEPDSFCIVRAYAGQESLHEVLKALPSKVRTIEAAFFDAGSEKTATPERQEACLIPVGVYVQKPEARGVVTLVLWERGCGIVPLETVSPADVAVGGVIADTSLPFAVKEHFTRQGIPLLCLPTRPRSAVSLGHALNVKRLHTWMHEISTDAPSLP